MQQCPYVNTVGFLIEADCGQNITGATDPVFRVKKPVSGTIVRWTATPFAIDGVTQGLKYATKIGDLNEPGIYKIHAQFSLGDWIGTGEVGNLTVRELFS